jgi:hypothetical protein
MRSIGTAICGSEQPSMPRAGPFELEGQEILVDAFDALLQRMVGLLVAGDRQI